MISPDTDEAGTPTAAGVTGQLDRIADLLVRLSLVLGGTVALAMVLNVAVGVALRSILNQPIQGTNQLVSYWWMLPLVFFGLAAAQWHDEHTDLPLVHARLSGRAQPVMTLVAYACTGLFVILFGSFGLKNALEQAAVGEYDSATGVIVWPPRFALPIACLAFILIIVAQMTRTVRALARRSGTDTETSNVLGDDQRKMF